MTKSWGGVPRKVIAWLIGLGLATLILASVSGVFHRHSRTPPVNPQAITRRLASLDQQQGLMSVADYMRLDAIRSMVASTGKVTEADFVWALGLMNRPLKPAAAPELHEQVLDTLLRAQFLTAEQKDRLYRKAATLVPTSSVKGSGDVPDLDKVEFATVVATLHDKRGVPSLKALEKDHNPDVAHQAKVALEALGVER